MSWGSRLNNSSLKLRLQDFINRYFRLGRIKVLTLIALASPIYFEDVGRLSGSIALFGIFFFNLIMKRHIIGDILEVERPNRKIGLVLFLCSLIMYIYGSYSTASPMLHIISLVLFASSYLMLRMNGLLLNILWLPLASMMLLSLSDNIVLLSGFRTIIASIILASITFLSSDIAPFIKIIVVIINTLAFTSLQIYLGVDVSPIYSILLSYLEAIIGLIIVQHFLSSIRISNVSIEKCPICSSNNALREFCPYCGRNLTDRIIPSRLEVLGLALAVLFSTSVLFISIPTLVLSDKGLFITYLAVQGPQQEEVIFISDGWLLYEEARIQQLEESFSEDLIQKQVLVPGQFPETKNYTIILEISSYHTRIADGWKFWPWNATDSQQVSLGGSISALYYEVTFGDQSLSVITWKDKIVINNGRGIIPRIIAVSIFTNRTLGHNLDIPSIEHPGMAQFLNDVSEISTSVIEKIGISSSWNVTLDSVMSIFNIIRDYMLIAMASGCIIATALFAVSRGDLPDAYLLEFLPKKNLDLLLAVDHLNESQIMATGETIRRALKEKSVSYGFDQQGIIRELENLERMKMLRKSIKLRNRSATMVWRLTF